jgi:Holliday junction resolvase RusA-like endonuclease
MVESPLLMTCERCGGLLSRRTVMQRYCLSCSETLSQKRIGARLPKKAKSDVILRGIEISKSVVRKAITQHRPFNADDGWIFSFKIPFSQAASKNHVWSLAGGGGHVFKRQQSRSFQNAIAHIIRQGTRDFHVYQNKIWIEFFVQKPHHKGDAINVVDVICDGIKVGLGIDDRWFCLRQVDWEIAKHDPQIFVTICQNQEFDAQACSHCGRILSLDNFRQKKTARLGVDRVCRECRCLPVRVETVGIE